MSLRAQSYIETTGKGPTSNAACDANGLTDSFLLATTTGTATTKSITLSANSFYAIGFTTPANVPDRPHGSPAHIPWRSFPPGTALLLTCTLESLMTPASCGFSRRRAFGRDESLHIYSNGLAVYLLSPSAERAGRIIEAGATFLSQMPTGPQKAGLRGLPANFSPLLPLVQAWGTIDAEEREERRETVSRPALQAMVEQVKPYLPAIDSYLRQFGGAPLTEPAVALGALAEFVVETELYLRR